jgi:hypothetical protein
MLFMGTAKQQLNLCAGHGAAKQQLNVNPGHERQMKFIYTRHAIIADRQLAIMLVMQ